MEVPDIMAKIYYAPKEETMKLETSIIEAIRASSWSGMEFACIMLKVSGMVSEVIPRFLDISNFLTVLQSQITYD